MKKYEQLQISSKSKVILKVFILCFSEQPIFSCKAHVFHIDPKTKRSWIPASSSAVSVSFFYDSTRSLYRIISVEGTKVSFPFISIFTILHSVSELN